MKNNTRIISFLKLFFQLAYKLSIFGFVLGTIVTTISLFSGEDFVGIPFKGDILLNLNASYSLFLEGSMNQEISLGVSHIVVESGSVFFQIYNILDLLIRGLILIFLFYNAYKVFDEFQKRMKSGSYFAIGIYHRIKRIGFLMLAYPIYFFINSVVFSCYFVSDLNLMGQAYDIKPDYSLLTEIISVLVVFVFAEIYRAGIEMKEESEYTI